MMRILLTSFEPFGKLRANPSELIVKALASRQESESGGLVAEVLPTEYLAAGNKIRRLIRRLRPDAVVCLGVAASRRKISLERFALNCDDETSPDNAGRVRSGRRIVPGAPLAFESTLPLGRLRAALQRAGMPVAISNHAGTYVCNHVFYVARHETEQRNRRIPCGLIHVPDLAKRARSSKSKGMKLEQMVAAVECCLKVLGRQ